MNYSQVLPDPVYYIQKPKAAGKEKPEDNKTNDIVPHKDIETTEEESLASETSDEVNTVQHNN
jgi:hypothetical protein